MKSEYFIYEDNKIVSQNYDFICKNENLSDIYMINNINNIRWDILLSNKNTQIKENFLLNCIIPDIKFSEMKYIGMNYPFSDSILYKLLHSKMLYMFLRFNKNINLKLLDEIYISEIKLSCEKFFLNLRTLIDSSLDLSSLFLVKLFDSYSFNDKIYSKSDFYTYIQDNLNYYGHPSYGNFNFLKHYIFTQNINKKLLSELVLSGDYEAYKSEFDLNCYIDKDYIEKIQLLR